MENEKKWKRGMTCHNINGQSCFLRISVSITTVMYAKQDNYLFVLPRMLSIFECGNIWEKWKSSIWEKWVTVLCELSCLLNEETTDSTYSALDEIVSSFMHEFLSIYTRFWASVRFFFTYSYSLRYHVP